MPDSQDEFDVIVIGAGPAGCAAATVLAERGRRVVMLERDRLPRYRIGESLIPHCWFPLERLGLVERVDAASFAQPKHSVQFISRAGVRHEPFYFFEHTDHPKARTWQVVRSEFDQLLLDNALAKGAQLLTETTTRELVRAGGAVVGVRVEGSDGARELRAPITIDASGRDQFASSRNRWRVGDERLHKYALWTYYEGALRDPGVDEGATTIAHLPEGGWFWYLPLVNDTVGVGIVADPNYLFVETRDQEQIFEREVAKQPWIRDHLRPGRRTRPFQSTHDFSYRARYCAEDGLVLTGDAFAFLDPVFSSGVYLALHGGVLVGDAAEQALQAGDASASRFAAYGERFCRNMEAMRRLVYTFYSDDFSFGDFFRAHPEMRSAVTDLLIGDLDRDYEPLFAAMSAFGEIPEPLSHGGPLERQGDPQDP